MLETQLTLVADHLKRYGYINTWQAITDYRVTRLSQYILMLRKRGWKIVSDWETDGKKRWVGYKLVAA